VVGSTPVTITGVTSTSIVSGEATISWITNEPADSQVEYGPTTSYGSSSPLDQALVTSHSITLSGLLANTTYYYRIRSRGAAGNLSVSPAFTLSASTNPWHNYVNPLDVDGLSGVVARDALLVINEINSHSYSDPLTGRLRATVNDPLQRLYFDV